MFHDFLRTAMIGQFGAKFAEMEISYSASGLVGVAIEWAYAAQGSSAKWLYRQSLVDSERLGFHAPLVVRKWVVAF
jgi:hypothetical protein